MAGDAAAGSGDFAQGIVEVVGPDLDAALRFYLALGFELSRRTGPFAVVHWRGQRLFLAEDAQAPTATRWANLRILVDDIDAVLAHVVSLGITPRHPLADRGYGLRDFVVAAPDGFEIRFAQAIAP